MFDNIGQKLQGLAVVSFILGVIASVISGLLYLFLLETILTGILIIVFGSLGSWIGSWSIYALGLVAENSERQSALLTLLYSSSCKTQQEVTTIQKATQSVAKSTKEEKTVKPKAPTVQVNTQEQTYLFGLQMYQQRSYDIALNAFLKIPGYKDADEYIAKLQK